MQTLIELDAQASRTRDQNPRHLGPEIVTLQCCDGEKFCHLGQEINEALNEIESEELDDAPIAPYWPSRPMVARQPACRSTATRLAAQVLSSRLARTRLARCATVDHRKARLADG
jgi:hypothetical protein